jgi:hypothetical protein
VPGLRKEIKVSAPVPEAEAVSEPARQDDYY